MMRCGFSEGVDVLMRGEGESGEGGRSILSAGDAEAWLTQLTHPATEEG